MDKSETREARLCSPLPQAEEGGGEGNGNGDSP